QSDDVTVNYIGSRTGNVYNWGTRGTTATFLTTPADEYYTGSYSYETLSALSGSSGSDTDFYSSALGTAIHNMLTAKQTSTTSYAGTTSLYAYTDCIESGNKISSFYSAALVGPNWDSGSTWNREHTWPNSKGQDGSDENDIMMLRPTAVSENSSRGNNAYGEGSGYYDPNKLGQNLHGDVARLMLQHLMRWGNTSKFYGTGGVMESRAILLKWLAEDPVDTWELGRNDAVQRITGVRNVFVDYPELAFKLLGAEVPANYTTPSASGIVAAATYSASAGSGYEPVTNGTATRSIAPAATEEAPTKGAKRSISAGQFNGIAIIDGMGATNVADDQAAYGPEHGVYLAPGQGIVFSLVSDVTTITSQDLQIGAKAVNGTATQIDVASISNGTESTGIKYLLENKAIASATEMYYELDTTQMGWNNGESSVLVIYNSGSGVLDVTNIRYSTVNGNTLTLNINEAEVQKAAKMIQIVYGEPITDPDPIEPTDPDLNFKSAELVLNSDIAINFNVDEAVMDSADGIFAVFTKALYNEAGEVTGYAEETVFEAIYNEETGLYSFRFTGINPAEMGSAVTAQLFGYRNGELISGKAINYSVLDYINRMYAKTDADSFRTLLADLAAYGAAAQNYVSYNTANLVTAKVADGLMAYATAGAPELSSCTAIRGSGDVEFTAAYLSLREKVTVCYVIDAADYDVADLELRIFDGAKQIGTAAFAEVGGKYVASFSGLNALQMRTVLTAEVYSGDTCVSNTLEYSIESYAAGKAAGNDALAALVNAMMNFGISAETYFAK
ncbi:MAG: endonuclease, partial [Clostridia bacterium]|nr:endonuclease [Clostridia bacterium]